MSDLTPAVIPAATLDSDEFLANGLKVLKDVARRWQRAKDDLRNFLGEFFYNAAVAADKRAYQTLMTTAVDGFSLTEDTITRYRTAYQTRNQLPAPNAKSRAQQKGTKAGPVSARRALTGEVITVRPEVVQASDAGGAPVPPDPLPASAQPPQQPQPSPVYDTAKGHWLSGGAGADAGVVGDLPSVGGAAGDSSADLAPVPRGEGEPAPASHGVPDAPKVRRSASSAGGVSAIREDAVGNNRDGSELSRAEASAGDLLAQHFTGGPLGAEGNGAQGDPATGFAGPHETPLGAKPSGGVDWRRINAAPRPMHDEDGNPVATLPSLRLPDYPTAEQVERVVRWLGARGWPVLQRVPRSHLAVLKAAVEGAIGEQEAVRRAPLTGVSHDTGSPVRPLERREVTSFPKGGGK